jgi:hypothetical protein
LITINSQQNDFSIGRNDGSGEKKERKTYFISNRHLISLPVSISFELTNWVNLSIIFDLFGAAVVYVQTMGDYHKHSSHSKRKLEGRKAKKTFC